MEKEEEVISDKYNAAFWLRTEIERHSYIVIARHVLPDCDAVGSQFGLASWIHDNWPDKSVYCIGHQHATQGADFWPEGNESVPEDILPHALGILVDTPSVDRIDDAETLLKCGTIIKIDHHPEREADLGDRRYVDASAASCTQMLAGILEAIGMASIVSKKTASFLMAGLLTDSCRFSTRDVTADTFAAAQFLADCGASISELNPILFDTDMRVWQYKARIMSNAVITTNKRVAAAVMLKETWQSLGLSEQESGAFVGILAGCKDFDAWALFAEGTDGRYRGSLRSREINVAEIAKRFGGGGHINAAGCSGLTIGQVWACIGMLTNATWPIRHHKNI